MMHSRWLALPLAVLTGLAPLGGCVTSGLGSGSGYASGPRLLPADLYVGALDQRTSFELDDAGSPSAGSSSAQSDAPKDRVDTPKKQRRRKILYFTGLGAAGFGALGLLGFGIGGRIVQGQLENAYDDGTLTREREDQLTTTGSVMNGLAIGSAVVGLAGIIVGATVYGIDHARCGDLPPRRKVCPHDAKAGRSNMPETGGPETGGPETGGPETGGPETGGSGAGGSGAGGSGSGGSGSGGAGAGGSGAGGAATGG